MAKTESTAVNQLIANVQGGKPLNLDDHWDSDDLGLERTNPTHDPAPVRKPSAPAVARTTASAPAMAPAAAPPPMPRSRSANGTEIPPMNASARTSVARVTTIPPLPAAAMNPRATMTGVPGGPTRTSTLPPPLRNSAPGVRIPDGTPAPELVAHGTIPPTGAVAAVSYPPPPPAVLGPSAYPPPPPADLGPSAYPPPPMTLDPEPVAPVPPPAFAPAPMAAPAPAPLTAQMRAPLPPPPMPAPGKPLDATTDWFLESSQAVPTVDEADIGTMGVHAKKKPKLGFLIGAALVCAIAGVFVGGYLVYDGAGNKAAAQSGTPSLQSEAKAAEQAAAQSFTGVGGRKAAAEPAAPAADQKAEPPATEPTPAVADDTQNAPTPAVANDTQNAPTPAVGTDTQPEPAVAKTEPAPAPAVAKTEPTPAPAPAVTDDAPAAPALVDVLFLSKPSGADVVLVDNGKTIPIGTTPVSASIDVKGHYEAVFALEGHKTRIAQLDPRHDRKVTIDLESGKTKVKHGEVKVAAAEPAPAPVPAPAAKTETRKVDKKADKKSDKKDKVAAVDFDTKPAAPAPAPAPAPKPDKKDTTEVAASGTGVLMIASKPPCQITIDGKATGLTTPQRSIELSAGTHKVTLVNADVNIKKTIAVKITAGKPTKLMQDYTSELK